MKPIIDVANDVRAVPVRYRPIPFTFYGHARPDVEAGLNNSIEMLHTLSILLARGEGLDEAVIGGISNLLDGIVKTLEGVQEAVMERGEPAGEGGR